MRMARWWWLIALTLLAGCSPPVSTEAAAKRVLAEDPAFQATLEQKSALDVEIAGLQRELFAKKSEIDQRVKTLQQEYRAAKRQIDAQVQGLVAQLNPQREQLRLEITLTENQLKSEQAEASNLKRSIAQLRASLKPAGTAPSGQTSADRAERLDTLTAQLAEHQAQVQQIQRRLQLLRLKLQLLRQ